MLGPSVTTPYSWYINMSTIILRFLKRALRNIHVTRANKMQTFFGNGLNQLYCLRHVSNNQVFILRKTCACSFMVFFLHPYQQSG